MSEQKYAVKVTFPEPRHGYWDGGKKGGGTFTPQLYRSVILIHPPDSEFSQRSRNEHPGPGFTIRWGCFALNFWFNAGSGRTWREAASIAKRKLMRMCGISGTTIEIVELERIDKASLVLCAG